jgi:NAD(P)-dependent dehydrogenase (short-subunit alcohol dehydrogenase family)
MTRKKKILFIGASGAVAEKVIPILSKTYDIVGVSGHRKNLQPYCIDFYTGDLFMEHQTIFMDVFKHHTFESIVWNSVRYFPSLVLKSTRQKLHAEFDLAIALPIECLRTAMDFSFSKGTFITITSLLAFGIKPNWSSYSITKRGQIILTEYLCFELQDYEIFPKAIALGSVPNISPENIAAAFTNAIENIDPSKSLYAVEK